MGEVDRKPSSNDHDKDKASVLRSFFIWRQVFPHLKCSHSCGYVDCCCVFPLSIGRFLIWRDYICTSSDFLGKILAYPVYTHTH